MNNFTLIHPYGGMGSYQGKLEHRGSYLAAYFHRLEGWRSANGKGPNDWPSTEAEIKAALSDGNANDILALKEKAQKTKSEEQHLEAAIEAGMKELAARLRRTPAIPPVPGDIYEKAWAAVPEDMRGYYEFDDLDVEYFLDYYGPDLDKVTANALLKASDDDRFPNFAMVAIGAHYYSQSWTDAEFKNWYEGKEGNNGVCIYPRSRRPAWPEGVSLTRTKRAELLAELTWDVMDYMQECMHLGTLEHTAKVIKHLPLQELNTAAEQAGIEITDPCNEAALVVAIIEHIYSDVIEPAETA